MGITDQVVEWRNWQARAAFRRRQAGLPVPIPAGRSKLPRFILALPASAPRPRDELIANLTGIPVFNLTGWAMPGHVGPHSWPWLTSGDGYDNPTIFYAGTNNRPCVFRAMMNLQHVEVRDTVLDCLIQEWCGP